MKTISFIFCVHNHQPVGNFDSVIESGYRSGYLPFLRVLARHPGVKVALHVSGALLEWMEGRHPEYLEEIRALVARGQLELMTGGFYEPILPAIPDEDKIGQTTKLSAFLKERLGFQPKGLWLAERVWEPSLASSLARAGVEYTVVDDSHFKSAGLTEGELLGCYLTEDQGSAVKVFSGSKRLRYLIPFAGPEETMELLRENASEEPGRLLVFADDGEKFGIWPGTERLCYQEGWLESFFETLEKNSEWVKSVTFSEYTSEHRPLGWVFLPTASYAEMMEWCLPVGAQLKYKEFLNSLEQRGELAEYESFVKGGFWRNFFSRYPESNWMYKRMLFARRRVSASGSQGSSAEAAKEALNEIWRAQCNCAYWHGVFGGLYLPHLREAIYRHIIRAERKVKEAGAGGQVSLSIERTDVNGDGANEVVLSSDKMACFVSPLEGGALVEMDHLGLEVNLVNTLARREEAYHAQLKHVGNPGSSSDRVVSIHDAVTSKEEKLEELLFYDRLKRVCLLDHLLPPSTSLEQMQRAQFDELGGFVQAPYNERLDEGGVVLSCSGPVRFRPGPVALTIEKSLSLSRADASLLVTYSLAFEESIPSALLFAPELNFLFPSGSRLEGTVKRGSGGKSVLKLASAAEFSEPGELRVQDDHFKFAMVVSAENATKLWHYPVETVSLSEAGLERIHQGTCMIPVWSLSSGSQKLRFTILIRLADAAPT
ncbi:MAG: DUF1926 domain-containing protein [Candidatus Eiseniibacteriota bacterium]|nr:MAG: DUF1926 domain-containing protein [Candidatus Eisenbacteria bacterium]